jgi:hypothetical protein
MPENKESVKGIHHSFTQVTVPIDEPPTALTKPKGTNSRQPKKKPLKAFWYRFASN